MKRIKWRLRLVAVQDYLRRLVVLLARISDTDLAYFTFGKESNSRDGYHSCQSIINHNSSYYYI